MKRPLVILGIDPGTTLGYAMVNLDRSIFEVGSSKQMDLNKLLRHVTDRARVLAVGTDKSSPPDFISKFSVSIGARLIYPKEDLSVKEKQEITDKTRNSHERDALASAYFAHKELRSLIEKIENFVRREEKLDIADELRYLVIKYQMSIRYALDILEKEDISVPEEIIIAEHIDPFKKIGSLHKILYDLKKESQFLKSRIQRLEDNLDMQKKINHILVKKQSKEELAIRKDQQVSSKKRMISAKDDVIKGLKSESRYLKEKAKDLTTLLVGDGLLAKRLDDLSTKEFKKKQMLIKKNDIIFVERADIISPSTREMIEKLELTVIFVKKPKNRTSNIFVGYDGIKILKKTDDFVLIDRDSYDKKLSKINLIDDIITAHRKRLS